MCIVVSLVGEKPVRNSSAHAIRHASISVMAELRVITVQPAPFAISHFVLQSLLTQADCS